MIDASVAPRFLHLERQWDTLVQRALIENKFSMPAGECFGAVVFADTLIRALPGLTHMVVFTDSIATARALTTGSSDAPQLNFLVKWLQWCNPGVQFLGIHQPGRRNCAADGLSRDKSTEVLAEAAAAGAVTVELETRAEAWQALASALAMPLKADARSATSLRPSQVSARKRQKQR